MKFNLHVYWMKRGDRPAHPADPQFPHGRTILLVDQEQGPTCTVDLPYPAKEVGTHLVECLKCGKTVAITAASRTDDPKRLVMSCKPMARGDQNEIE